MCEGGCVIIKMGTGVGWVSVRCWGESGWACSIEGGANLEGRHNTKGVCVW